MPLSSGRGHNALVTLKNFEILGIPVYKTDIACLGPLKANEFRAWEIATEIAIAQLLGSSRFSDRNDYEIRPDKAAFLV